MMQNWLPVEKKSMTANFIEQILCNDDFVCNAGDDPTRRVFEPQPKRITGMDMRVSWIVSRSNSQCSRRLFHMTNPAGKIAVDAKV